MPPFELIIGLCWIAFLGTWLVLGTASRAGRQAFSPRARAVRLLLLIALVLGLNFGDRIPALAFGRFASGMAAAGCALCLVGLAFAIWARVALGRSWGMPMTVHESPELVTSGPYRYVRHPIYTGIAAMAVGTALVFPLAWIWAVGIIAYMIYSARREERDMERRFPEAYPAYKRRSKMLVPFLL